MAIQNLTKVTSLSSSDVLALFSASTGSDVGATLATFITWLQSQITADSALVHQYYAATGNGWTVTITPTTYGGSVLLLFTPAGSGLTGTVVLPSNPVHGQEVQCTTTQSLTITVSSAKPVNGAQTTMVANGFWRLRYDGAIGAWYRLG